MFDSALSWLHGALNSATIWREGPHAQGAPLQLQPLREAWQRLLRLSLVPL